MKTILKDLFQADWGPTMRGIAYALGYAVMVPVAVALVLAQWLAFTYQRPLAGMLALVPVQSNSGDAASSPKLASSYRDLTTSDLAKAGASVVETELGPMVTRMGFGVARPVESLAPFMGGNGDGLRLVFECPPVILCGGGGGSIAPASAPESELPAIPPVLKPGPRRQRRGSKRPQFPA